TRVVLFGMRVELVQEVFLRHPIKLEHVFGPSATLDPSCCLRFVVCGADVGGTSLVGAMVVVEVRVGKLTVGAEPAVRSVVAVGLARLCGPDEPRAAVDRFPVIGSAR